MWGKGKDTKSQETKDEVNKEAALRNETGMIYECLLFYFPILTQFVLVSTPQRLHNGITFIVVYLVYDNCIEKDVLFVE